MTDAMAAERPYTLIAELTYRCPLRCTYCSNPVDLAAQANELSTAEWSGALDDAEGLGVLQVHFTGGEPLLRKDLEVLVARARALSLYSNLITSGVSLTRDRLVALRDAGLDSVQLSLQGASAEVGARVAGVDVHRQKLEVAAWVKAAGLPLTVNVVLHRDNIDAIDDVIALADALAADRLELANAQYHGWALLNRGRLLPSLSQVERARAAARAAKAARVGKMEVLFVMPDYFEGTPKACMDGWARRFITMSPDGTVLPCHAAASLTHLSFESVRARPLSAIWEDSPAFVAYRGDGWMGEPCRSCPRKTVDFGGCRCQSFALTGDAAATDPACSLSPHHAIVRAERARGEGGTPAPDPVYRLRRAKRYGAP